MNWLRTECLRRQIDRQDNDSVWLDLGFSRPERWHCRRRRSESRPSSHQVRVSCQAAAAERLNSAGRAHLEAPAEARVHKGEAVCIVGAACALRLDV